MSNQLSPQQIEALRKIKLLILDVDGVLTDGKIWFSPQGDEYKAFHTQDGVGIKRLQQHGITVAIISGRSAETVRRRAKELGITALYEGQKDKIPALQELMQHHQLTLEQIAYIGDDLPDLPVMQQIGFPVAVANATPPVKKLASWQTQKPGGQAAVREFCDLVLDHV